MHAIKFSSPYLSFITSLKTFCSLSEAPLPPPSSASSFPMFTSFVSLCDLFKKG